MNYIKISDEFSKKFARVNYEISLQLSLKMTLLLGISAPGKWIFYRYHACIQAYSYSFNTLKYTVEAFKICSQRSA